MTGEDIFFLCWDVLAEAISGEILNTVKRIFLLPRGGRAELHLLLFFAPICS